MIEHYIEAVRRALGGVLDLLTQVALPLGLLLNFKVAHMRDGITRKVNAPERDL